MPKSETSNSNDGPSFQAPRYRPNWLAALFCFAIGAFLLVALVTYDPAQSGFHTMPPTQKNPAGIWGANAIWTLLYTIGFSTGLVPFFLLLMLYVSRRSSKHLTGTRTVAMIFACISLAGLTAMLKDGNWGSDWYPNGYGGLVGRTLYHRMLADALGPFGTSLILGTIYAGSLLFIFTKDIGAEF